MRIISGIKYTVTIIIAAIFIPSGAYSQMEVNNLLNIDTPQTTNPLTKQGTAEENRMIREDHLDSYFMVKVTTTNQKKFDGNHDGYLTGTEFQRYLKHYSR